jgi:hypothetical protein
MKRRILTKLLPRIIGMISVAIAGFHPDLEGSEEVLTAAIMGLWAVWEYVSAKRHSERQQMVQEDQQVLKNEGAYAGKVDGKYGALTSTAVRRVTAAASDHPEEIQRRKSGNPNRR